MLVRFPQTLVIAEYFNYDQFGEIVLALPAGRRDAPIHRHGHRRARARRRMRGRSPTACSRITLDDTLGGVRTRRSLRHPNGDPFSLTNRFRGGDTVANTVGVLGFDFSQYRIQPTAAADYTAVNPRPAAPEPVGGTLRAAAMNTLNFFLTLDTRPRATPARPCGGQRTSTAAAPMPSQTLEFTRQRDKLLQALAGLDADIIGLNEIENTPGVEPAWRPDNGIVAGLNAMPGVGPYAFIDTGVIGTDAIRVGLIYRPDKVAPVGPFKVLTQPSIRGSSTPGAGRCSPRRSRRSRPGPGSRSPSTT